MERATYRFIENHIKDGDLVEEYNKIDILYWKSFNSIRKRSTLIYKPHTSQDHVIIFNKGAPNAILKICNQVFACGD